MHFKDFLLDYINDKNYFISIYENNVHIFNYYNIIEISNTKIEINIKNFNIIIEGNDLSLTKMTLTELLISGNILKVYKKYD